MNTENQEEIWQDLDELYMDIEEWIPFLENLLENGQLKLPTQIVFGKLTIKQLINQIRKDLIKYSNLLEMISTKKDKIFLKIIPSANELLEQIERRIYHESI